MSAIETNRGYRAGGLGHILAGIAALVAAWKYDRTTRRELSLLSDRELDDIGLCRGDILRIARGF